MSDTGLVGLFVTQFGTLLELKLQQRNSMLRSRVEEGYHAGAKMAAPINQIDAVQTRTPEGRFSPKKVTPSNYTRRWVTPIDKVADQYVDTLDQLRTPIDPKSKLVENVAAACGRDWDDEIIRAATAVSTIGADAGSLNTEPFDTATFQVAGAFGASAAVGLTVAKLNEARRLLEHYHNTEELNAGGATLVIGSKQHADLRNQALVTSSEFNNQGGVLVEGRVTKYMGFDVCVSERLPVITDVNAAANQRGCLVFVKSGLYLGMWQDLKTEVFRRADLENNPWDISTTHTFGATRTQLGKIIQVCALDTTGADITP